jgi:hypothetical protein
LFVVASHWWFVPHGVCFNDPSVYYHFGHRLLDGAVPYRDYVFQVGPLPIYVDALFQKVFGSTYLASLWASLAIKILRLWVVWLVAERVGRGLAAGLLTVFFALTPIFAFSYHWSTPYAQLFIAASALFFVLATRSKRAHLLYLAFAGANAALVVTARQSSAIVIAVLLLATTITLFIRRVYFTWPRLAALWGGFAAALALFAISLASAGALGAALEQLFVDAPEKKGIHVVDAILDAISGGSLVVYKFDPSFTWWSGLLAYLGLPTLVVGAILYLLAFPKRAPSPQTLGLIGIPGAVLIASLTRYAVLDPFSDLPRTFLTLTTIVSVVSPKRLLRWFGLHPVAAIGLGTLPLATDWAMELSLPGRGWGDATSLVTGVLLFCLASRRLGERVKVAGCAALALVGLLHFGVYVRAGVNPFAKDDSADGTLAENHIAASHPMLRGLLINEPRQQALDWLLSKVHPDSTCFVYGNLPVLYDLLACKNPTRVDSTLADFITNADAQKAIDDLERSPPEWIIAQEKSWMNPDLADDMTAEYEHLNSLNRETSKTLHLGLRRLVSDDYEVVGEIGEALGPELARQAASHRDMLDATRLYHRKQGLIPMKQSLNQNLK